MIGTSLSGHTYHSASVCVYVHSFNYSNKMLPKPLTRRQCSSSNVYVTVKILCIMTPDMWECGLTPCDTCDNILMFMFMLIYILLFLKSAASHYGTANFSWAFRQLCKPKQSLNNFILVPMKASTVLGTLQFAPHSFLELSNHQNLSQTSRNKRLNESQWVLMSVNETHQDSVSLTKTH